MSKDKKKKKTAQASLKELAAAEPVASQDDVANETLVNPMTDIVSDFSSFYLRKVTMELSEDLDKIRASKDFKASSLPVLIAALKQGEDIFSEEEKTQIMEA